MSLQKVMTGRIDERESAFPQAVQLPDGDILCSFSVGGGQYVHGGTDWARSTDGGCTWHVEGQLLPGSVDSPFRDPAGRQGVVMALVKFTETEWTVVEEDLLNDVCGIRWTRLAVTW